MAVEGQARSLRRWLTVWLIVSTLALGAVALWDTFAEARRTARDVSDRVLVGSALAIADGVTVEADGGVSVAVPFSALAMLSSAAQDQVFYRVDGPDGLLTGYGDLPPVVLGPGDRAFADATYRNTRIRTVTLLRELTGSQGLIPIRVTVAESTRAREGLARQILARSALRLALLIAGAAVVAWVTATQALRPVSRLSRLLAERAPHDVSPVAAPAPEELQPVLTALNGFLARLQGAIATLRGFASSANHQIRTPLAVARTQIAVARKARTVADRAEALDKADAALVRSERVLAQLLVLAQVKATGDRPALAPCDLAALCRAVVEEQLPDAIRRGQDLGYDGPDSLSLPTAEVLLGEAIRNLTGNAVAHCPPGTVVTLRLSLSDGAARIEVSDDGPALPDPAFAALSDRLSSDAAEGMARLAPHGLGLLIVREISQTLGLDVTLARRPEGGLSVTLSVPTGPSEA